MEEGITKSATGNENSTYVFRVVDPPPRGVNTMSWIHVVHDFTVVAWIDTGISRSNMPLRGPIQVVIGPMQSGSRHERISAERLSYCGKPHWQLLRQRMYSGSVKLQWRHHQMSEWPIFCGSLG